MTTLRDYTGVVRPVDRGLTGIGALLRRTVEEISAREGLTHGQIAERAGIGQSNLSRSYSTARGVAVLLAVCKAFNLRIEVVPNK